MALSFSEVKCYSDDIIHWRSVSTIWNSAVAKLKNLESDKNSCLVAKKVSELFSMRLGSH